jgi:hypothetical protein
MSLVKQNLENAIKAALHSAVDAKWSLDEVAAAWADAIHSYVSQGEVSGVTSTVTVELDIPAEQGTGTASQTGTVNLT